MRYLPILGLFIVSLIPAPAAAQRRGAPADRPLGTQIEWSYEQQRNPVRYRFGDVTLTVRGIVDGEMIAPRITVEAPGRPPAVMTGSSVGPTFTHQIGVGRFDRSGATFVQLQSFTGGAHCCNAIQVAVIEGRRIRVVELGFWDGEGGDMPRDEDGDGLVDFVQRDDSFLYAFTYYAASLAPPRVLNIVDGRVVDVSDRPGFRGLFQAFVNDVRSSCLAPEGDAEPNGACAAYVAAAARAGQFDAAWARMLRAYNRRSDWELPTGCRVDVGNAECPPASVIRYRTYPEALRYFLVRRGYIRR
jgi:hypothetical protein